MNINLLETKKLNLKDCSQIARIHINAFPSFFLTKLGNKFLIEFYKAILKSNQSVCIGLYLDNNLVGFAIGIKRSNGFYSKLLLNNFLKLSLSAFIPILLNPSYIFRLLLSFSTNSKLDESLKEDSMLLSLCIDKNINSKGFGSILLNKFENEIFKFSNTITLTTDAIDNESVNAFYIKNGYILKTIFYQGKRQMNFYIKNK